MFSVDIENRDILNRDIGSRRVSLPANKVNLPNDNGYRRRIAILVGVNSYQNNSASGAIGDLNNPVNDVCALYKRLSEVYDFDCKLFAAKEDVIAFDQELLTCVHGNGTRGDILDALYTAAATAQEDDLILFYYSGHGTQDGFILPYGTISGKHETHLSYGELFQAFKAVPSLHQMLFFDCCFAGAAWGGVDYINRQNSSQVCFAVTDDFNVAPDAFLVEGLNCGAMIAQHSPFAYTLLEDVFRDPFTQDLPVETIQQTLVDGVPVKTDGIVTPCFHTRGTGHIVLKALHRMPSTESHLVLYLGANKIVYIDCPQGCRNVIQSPVPWTVLNENVLNVNAGVEGVPLGNTIVEVKTVNLITGNTVSTHFLKITVLPLQDGEPLSIITEEMQVCYADTGYRCKLKAAGGQPPYAWKIDGLPKGLSYNEQEGVVYGIVRAEDVLAGGQVCILNVTVSDVSLAQVCLQVAIPLIDINVYCEIVAGPCKCGYHGTPERERVLKTRLGKQIEAIKDFQAATGNTGRFFIRRTPVTRGQWLTFREKTEYAGLPFFENEYALNNKHFFEYPVTGLTGEDVMAFCEKRNTSLPTSVQFQKAARGGDDRLFPWGDHFSSHYCNCPEQYGSNVNLGRLRFELLTRVDQYPHAASPYGVMDLIGNSAELIQDLYYHDGKYKLSLMGGAFYSNPLAFTTFSSLNKDGIDCNINQSQTQFVPNGVLSEFTTFRDVIEVETEPPYHQGFVKIAGVINGIIPNANDRFQQPGDFYVTRYQVSNQEYAEDNARVFL